MTVLLPFPDRQSINIDTYERGFIYAALLLRASNTNPENTIPRQQNKYFNAVKIALNLNNYIQGVFSPLIVCQAKIPYLNNLALRQGGNFLSNLGSFKNSNPNPFLGNLLPTTGSKLVIVEEPNWVNSLEKYLAWTAQNINYGFLKSTKPLNNQQVTLQFLEEDFLEPSLLINAAILIDYAIYLKTYSLLASVKTFINSSLEVDAPSSSGNIDNTFTVDNLSLVGN